MRYILVSYKPEIDHRNKKVKALLKLFVAEIAVNPELKSIIPKKSIKSLQPWLLKMDHFFKAVKYGHDYEMSPLFLESSKVFGILNISATKMFEKKKLA